MRKTVYLFVFACVVGMAQVTTINSTDIVADSRTTINTNFANLDAVSGTNLILSDTYANLPAAGTAGRLFTCTDCPYSPIIDNGSSWDHFLPGDGQVTPPAIGDFSAVNSASGVTTYGGILLTAPSGGGGLRLYCKSIPSVPYTVTARIRSMLYTDASTDYSSLGLAWRQSSDGKLHAIGLQFQKTSTQFLNYISSKYTNPTTFSASYGQQSQGGFGLIGGSLWLRIEDDNTDRNLSYSSNGKTWHEFDTIGRTDFLTGDEVCLWVDTPSGSVDTTGWFLSWEEE